MFVSNDRHVADMRSMTMSPGAVSAATSSHLHAADGRLHAGLRILTVVLALIVGMSLAALPHLWYGRTLATFLQAVLMLPLMGAGFFLLAPRLDRRPVGSYGMQLDRGWWSDLVAGIVIGTVMVATAAAVLLGGGWAQVEEVWSPGTTEPAVAAALAAALLLTAVTALWEELVFRGHLIANAAERRARRRSARSAVAGGVLLSIPAFASLHVFSLDAPGTAPWGLALAHLLALGALLGVAYAFSGRLALPLGIHIAHNLSVVAIVGMRGEFSERSATVVRLGIDGPSWLVGMSGIAQLIGVGIGSAVLWAWLRRSGRPSIHEDIARSPDRTPSPSV